MARSLPTRLLICALVATTLAVVPATSSAGVLDLSAAPIETSGVHGPDNPSFIAEHAFDGNTGTRWAAIYGVPNQWVYVDLGADYALNSVSVDWETANATSYNILVRTEAQGSTMDPTDWTAVATVTGSSGAPGGGAPGGGVGGFDHVFDFEASTVESGLGGTNTIDVPNPIGRYLMLNGFNYAGSCCGGASIWEIVVDADPAQLDDTDGDGLPDQWETDHGLDSNDDGTVGESAAGAKDGPNGAQGDPDGDGSLNLQEYNRSTDPQDADTDDDGYPDGAETKTGVWVSVTDTGTDPRNPDSDGDTLDDGLENPDLPYLDASQPGTNPNLVDTDGDSLSDSVELAQGSDPTDPLDPGVLDLSAATVVESSIHGGNPIFIGSNAFDGSVGTRWAAEFPDTQQWLYVDLGQDLALKSVTIDWETANATDYSLRMRTDSEGPTDDPADWTTAVTVTGTAGLPGGGAVGNDHLFNFVHETLTDISGVPIGGEATFLLTEPVGRYLMIETSNYSTTCCGGPSIWEVRVIASPASSRRLQFDLDSDSSSGNLNLRWDSQDGKLYTLRSETDPSATDPPDWPVFDGNADLAATPPENTLIIPLPADLERFFVVEEFNAPPVSIFFDDFESGQGLWTTGSDGANGTAWELGTPSNVGPAAANSPANCFATNISSNYEIDADIWLRSPPIDLSTAAGATVRYFQYVDIEEAFDSGRVAVLDASDNAEIAILDAPVDGLSGWEQVRKVLPAEALGKTIVLEFRLRSDELENLAGWYLDDVEVTVP